MGKFSAAFIKARYWIANAINVQLLTTALSLPILIIWGLPLSMMSIVGNLLATPFLMGVLFLCSLLFLTELIGLPNSMLYYLTDFLIAVWDKLLSFGKKSWLVGFSAPSLGVGILLCLVTVGGLWCLVRYGKISIAKASISMIIMCLAFCSFFQNDLSHGLEHIHCIKRHNKRMVVDDGFFRFKTSYKSPVRYQIKPLLYKVFGSIHIKRWHVTYAGIRSLRALCELLNEIRIDEITFDSVPKKQIGNWKTAWQELVNKGMLLKTKITVVG